MPVGNITPKTDAFTRASVLLGPEEYPSTAQQALAKNHGYLMYRPSLLYSGYGYSNRTGTSGTFYNSGYLVAGKYDIICNISIGAENEGYGTISLDGTDMAILDEAGPFAGTVLEGSIDAFTVASGGFYYGVVEFNFPGGAMDSVRSWSVYFRQYEE